MSCCQHSYSRVDSDENCVINTVGMNEMNDNVNKFERFINEIINLIRNYYIWLSISTAFLMKS